MITIKTTSSRAVLMPDGTTTMYTMHITADTVADIPAPAKNWDAGSRCDVLADGGKTYILSNAGQWEEVHFFGNGGSSAPVDAYTKEEADALYMRNDAIAKLNSLADFEALPEKTAAWYFIKEDT